jgi:nucleotide-binding universal stress UspA family protein
MPIVAAIDPSPAARPVLDRAIDQARKAGTALHVVHVFHPPTALYAMSGSYVFEEETLEEAERRSVWESVGPQLETAGDIEVVRQDLRGYPVTLICEYAEDVDADLIVMGRRGRGGFSSLVLGSTSQGVLTNSHCDVMIVKSPADPK